MLLPTEDLAEILHEARVVILVTEVHPVGLILHLTDATATDSLSATDHQPGPQGAAPRWSRAEAHRYRGPSRRPCSPAA